jgi:DNA repair protein RadC
MPLVSINTYSLRQVREDTGRYDVNRFVTSPIDARNAFNAVFDLENAAEERFCILTLNTKNRIAGAHLITIGTIGSAHVYHKEVLKAALLNNAASFICCHNHPSGDPVPSSADVEMTKHLAKSGELLGIELLDHIIIGHDGRFVSLKEMGVI